MDLPAMSVLQPIPISVKQILLTTCFFIVACNAPTSLAAADTRLNLALNARASAFEFQPGLPAELAKDGTTTPAVGMSWIGNDRSEWGKSSFTSMTVM
ncbi:MAG: hypothetical protein NTW03_20050 [Verrucomicrobia bacterium]|nr:hypothetical protein [Verrucomicrobiota bacterium]